MARPSGPSAERTGLTARTGCNARPKRWTQAQPGQVPGASVTTTVAVTVLVSPPAVTVSVTV